MPASTEPGRDPPCGTLPGPPRMPRHRQRHSPGRHGSTEIWPTALRYHEGSGNGQHNKPKGAEDSGAHVSRETWQAVDRPPCHFRAATVTVSEHRRRARQRAVMLGTSFTAAALGLGTLLVQPMGPRLRQNPASVPPSQKAAASMFSGELLKDQVTDSCYGSATRFLRHRNPLAPDSLAAPITPCHPCTVHHSVCTGTTGMHAP